MFFLNIGFYIDFAESKKKIIQRYRYFLNFFFANLQKSLGFAKFSSNNFKYNINITVFFILFDNYKKKKLIN